MGEKQRSRGWTFTDYGIDEVPRALPDGVSYLIWQLERCPTTGREHAQGYIHYECQRTLLSVSKQFPRAHLLKSRGTPQENRVYCTKEETRIDGPFEYGVLPVQGARSDLNGLRAAIKRGATQAELGEMDCWWRYHKAAKIYRDSLNPPNSFSPVKCFVLVGSTGSGKTRWCYENYPQLFKMSCFDPPWFDGYEGEDTILFDDFYGGIKHSQMLQLLDGYPQRLPVKGGFVQKRWKTVLITSNKHPQTWYSNEHLWPPLARRLDTGGIANMTDMDVNGRFEFA